MVKYINKCINKIFIIHLFNHDLPTTYLLYYVKYITKLLHAVLGFGWRLFISVVHVCACVRVRVCVCGVCVCVCVRVSERVCVHATEVCLSESVCE